MILGLFGRIIGAAIAIEILIFIAFEKLPIELSLGYEMNILLLAIAIMFALAGSGLFSIDRAIARSLLKKIPNIKHEAYVIAETPYRERWYE